MPQVPAEKPCSHLLATGGDSEQENSARYQTELECLCGSLFGEDVSKIKMHTAEVGPGAKTGQFSMW